VAQGAAGLALLLPTVAIIVSILLSQVGRGGIAGSLDQALERAQISVADGARATRAADQALISTGTSTEETSAMLSELARTMRSGSESLRVNLFGQQPFLALADSFALTAERADLAAASVGATGPQVELTRRSLTDLSADLDSLAVGLAAVRASGTSETQLLVLGILLLSVAGWLAIGAAICLGAGWRLLRPPSDATEPGQRGAGGRRTPVRGTIGRAS